jgi:hypothetical protein
MTDWTAQVAGYLAYCKRAAAELKERGSSLENHPSPEGAVKLIPHRGDPAEAKAIRAAFTELAEPAEPAA